MAVSRGAAAILQKPISRAQLHTSLAHLGLDEQHDRTRTILVVDDDPLAVELIAALLPAPAYAVIRASSGAEAIVLAQRVLQALTLDVAADADALGLAGRAALLREEGLGVGLGTQRLLLPRQLDRVVITQGGQV